MLPAAFPEEERAFLGEEPVLAGSGAGEKGIRLERRWTRKRFLSIHLLSFVSS